MNKMHEIMSNKILKYVRYGNHVNYVYCKLYENGIRSVYVYIYIYIYILYAGPWPGLHCGATAHLHVAATVKPTECGVLLTVWRGAARQRAAGVSPSAQALAQCFAPQALWPSNPHKAAPRDHDP